MIIAHQVAQAVDEEIGALPLRGMAVFLRLLQHMGHGQDQVAEHHGVQLVIVFQAEMLVSLTSGFSGGVIYRREGQHIGGAVYIAEFPIDLVDGIVIA